MESSTPRIGVFFCDCGQTIKGLIDYDKLRDLAQNEKDVVHVDKVDFLCSSSSRESVTEAIRENGLDRIVVAACSPRAYLLEFQDVAERAGINRFMVEQSNLRDQVAWIHSLDEESATSKAMDQLAMSIARARKMRPSRFGPGAAVNEEMCSGCGVCATTCKAGVIDFKPIDGGHRVARVDRSECKACGACVAACPSGALNLEGFTNEEVIAEVDEFTEGLLDSKEPSPAILVFACHWCSYPAADLAGLKRMQMDARFRMIRTPCSARVDPEWVMRAMSRGVDGVLVLGGSEGNCHYQGGNVRTRNRMLLLNKVLEQLGFDTSRLAVEWIDADEPYRFRAVIEDFVTKIAELGPSPMRAPAEEEKMTSALYHGRDELTHTAYR